MADYFRLAEYADLHTRFFKYFFKVAELVFKWVDVDDGFQIAEGDWETNSRFNGTKDMRRITDAIHSYGLKAKLWWAPLAADPDTKILREKPEMLLQDFQGAPEYITWWDSWYLSPVNPVTREYTVDLVKRFIDEWGFDGLKLDGQHLNRCHIVLLAIMGLEPMYCRTHPCSRHTIAFLIHSAKCELSSLRRTSQGRRYGCP